MAESGKSPEDTVFQSLSIVDRQIIKDFLLVSSRSNTRESTAEQHLMIALNFALARQSRAI